MQMCPDCNRVYDESEYTRCPYCYSGYNRRRGRMAIVCNRGKESTKRFVGLKEGKHNYKD